MMQVQDQILSPRFGGPIIGAIRDFITASYMFTRKSNLLTKEEVCRLLVASGFDGPLPEPAVKDLFLCGLENRYSVSFFQKI